MSEDKRAKADTPVDQMTAEQQAQHASDTLKSQIAALRTRVRKAQERLSAHFERDLDKSDD